jgi:hypothetical protein
MTTLTKIALVALLAIPGGRSAPQERPEPLEAAIELARDIAWLERIASDRDFAHGECVSRRCSDLKYARTEAYIRLGALATPAALEAIRRIEQRAENRSTIPPSVSATHIVAHPAPHIADGAWPEIGGLELSDGRAYALLSLSIYGRWSLFLTWRTSPNEPWTRPFLVPVDVDPWTTASVRDAGNGRLRVTFAKTEATTLPLPGPYEIVLADITRDRDDDGWTDLEESQLGLNPRLSDTDRDGIPDGRDATPRYSARGAAGTGEDEQILHRAIFCAFGLTDAPYALYVEPGSQQLQLRTAAGPVFYEPPGRRDRADVVKVSWRILERHADSATVTISDYEGPLAASSWVLELRRIGTEWVVANRGMSSIS